MIIANAQKVLKFYYGVIPYLFDCQFRLRLLELLHCLDRVGWSLSHAGGLNSFLFAEYMYSTQTLCLLLSATGTC